MHTSLDFSQLNLGKEELKLTENAQPALLAHSMAVMAVLKVYDSISHPLI